jgi:hypothetical protein
MRLNRRQALKAMCAGLFAVNEWRAVAAQQFVTLKS